jgi:hypothetical protein
MASRADQTSCSSPPPSENTRRGWRLGEGQVNWTQTMAQSDVQQALAANVFRQIVLGQRT